MENHQIDFGAWSNFKKGQSVKPTGSKTVVKLAAPGMVTVHKAGCIPYLVGYGTAFTLNGDFDHFISDQSGSVKRPPHSSIKSNEPPFTNINKLPHVSPETAAVTLALRSQKADMRKLEAKMRADTEQWMLEQGFVRPEEGPVETPDETPEEISEGTPEETETEEEEAEAT